jgi:hypothetical protein
VHGVTCVALALAVSSLVPGPAVPAVAGSGRSGSTGAVPGAHDCVPRKAVERGDARVAWKRLRNPILATDHMTKDQTIRLVDGQWHLFASERFEAPDPQLAGHWVSDDLTGWSPAPPAQRWGSPDITRDRDGRYLVTHQVDDPVEPDVNQLFATAFDDELGATTASTQLVPGLFPDERLIDAALAHTEHGLFLFFKRGFHNSSVQHDELAWSPSGSIDGPWQHLGEPDLPWSENFELLPIDGRWHVVLTTIPVHHPALYRLDGDPSDERSWLRWKKVRIFDVPEESWNRGRTPGITHETANSAYLCDARRLDGHWYLFYAGSTELTTFEGRGHAQIGVARSDDLVHWRVPPG